MHPNHAARGSDVSFFVANRGRKTQTFVFGDVKRGVGAHATGFGRTLTPDRQLTVVLYRRLIAAWFATRSASRAERRAP